MRLIDADAYKAEMKQRQDACAECRDEAKACCDTELFVRADGALSVFIEAKLTLDKMPTIDAVPVVRCRECIYNRKGEYPDVAVDCEKDHDFARWLSPDFYCADGERKAGDNVRSD